LTKEGTNKNGPKQKSHVLVLGSSFKEMYFRAGGKVPSWGVPLTELMADKII
jgi:hypothetical protein